jgi:hypothetical protein
VVRRPEAVALAEMLVDDEAVGQAEPGRQAHAAGARRAAFVAEGDHVLAEERGAGAGAGHRHAAALRSRIGLATACRRSGGERSWLPPVKNTPLACSMRCRRLRSSRRDGCRSPSPCPRLGAEFAEDALVTRPGGIGSRLAVGITTMSAASPPHSSTKRRRIAGRSLFLHFFGRRRSG